VRYWDVELEEAFEELRELVEGGDATTPPEGGT